MGNFILEIQNQEGIMVCDRGVETPAWVEETLAGMGLELAALGDAQGLVIMLDGVLSLGAFSSTSPCFEYIHTPHTLVQQIPAATARIPSAFFIIININKRNTEKMEQPKRSPKIPGTRF